MRTLLRFTTGAAILVLIGYLLDPVVGPVMLVDNILPQSLLRKATPEELKLAAEGLENVVKPKWITIFFLVTIIIGNASALFIANRNYKKHSPNQTVEPMR